MGWLPLVALVLVTWRLLARSGYQDFVDQAADATPEGGSVDPDDGPAEPPPDPLLDWLSGLPPLPFELARATDGRTHRGNGGFEHTRVQGEHALLRVQRRDGELLPPEGTGAVRYLRFDSHPTAVVSAGDGFLAVVEGRPMRIDREGATHPVVADWGPRLVATSVYRDAAKLAIGYSLRDASAEPGVLVLGDDLRIVGRFVP